MWTRRLWLMGLMTFALLRASCVGAENATRSPCFLPAKSVSTAFSHTKRFPHKLSLVTD